MLKQGHLGIHPPGALGVGFFMHAGADCLVGRTGDGITHLLKEAGAIRVADVGDSREEIRSISLKGRVYTNLLEAEAREGLPEVLFVCCNPDQLGLFTGELTRFLENLAERGKLQSEQDIEKRVPILFILPNGILMEQTLETYRGQITESMLMDRLPGVTEAMVEQLMDRVVRGISLQAGGRRGQGKETVYLLERKGMVLFAGGGNAERDQVEAIVGGHGYPFRHVKGVPGTRIEFDKAMISIVLNVGGLIYMVKESGELIDLRMGELCEDGSKQKFVEEVTRAVFAVGVAIGAYPEDASYEEVWAEHRATIMKFKGHVTSSVKSFREGLERGLHSVKLFTNEEWILTPLRRYAANAGMAQEEKLFSALAHRVQHSMARAIKYVNESPGRNGTRRSAMKLAAQRNISIDLYESGEEDVVLVGTFLDGEHLIKLEVSVHLPDEQITRSELQMIRSPFPVCREVEQAAERLVGLRIERGVLGEIGRRIGGRAGCSHIRELATSIVHFMAVHLVRKRAGFDPFGEEYAHTPKDEQFSRTRELLKDSCLAFCQTTSAGLDECIGIRRVGEDHACPIPLGEHEPSMGVLVRDRAKQGGERVYVRYREGDREISVSWKAFGETVFRIASHLIDHDIRPGDRIAMISENRVEMFIFEMAVMAIGAVSVPVFAGYHAAQVGYMLRHARPKVVVVSGMHQLEKIERDRHAGIERYFAMDFDERCGEWGAADFSELTKSGGAMPLELEARVEAVKPDDLCLIMYTSGTTGPPKGVKLTHGNLISQQKALSLLWKVDEEDAFMSYLPWHHSFGGLFERFMTLYRGCELCLDDSRGRDTKRMLDNWRAFKPSIFFSVPRVHEMLLVACRENKEIDAMVFGGRLRLVFTAGAALPAPVEAQYRDRKIPVYEGWGLTETSPCVTVTDPTSEWRSGYVGFPIPGVTVRVDGDQEVLVKGANVMTGYLDDEDATSRVIDEDGWFHTGDLGEFTPYGLRIFGRRDGAFKLTTGEKVHPQRVESTLVNESPFISTAVVVGNGKNFVGSLIYPNFSRLKEWAQERGMTTGSLTEEPEVRALFAAEIDRVNPKIEVKYQRVRRVVLADRAPSLERGELTPSAKIVRARVFDSFKHEFDELFKPSPSEWVIEIMEPELQKA